MGLIDKIKASIEKDKQTKEQYYSQSGNSIFKTLFNTGAKGEYLTYRKISRVSENNYCIANLYVPKEDGTSSEIDMVMVHETGIYVFESKNYSGWIYGSQDKAKWMQILPAGKGRSERHQFYNPIWQNQTHIRYLKKHLKTNVPFFSYVVFSEKCEFQDVQYNDDIRVIYRDELSKTLKKDINEHPVVLGEQQMEMIFNLLNNLSNKPKEEKVEHIEEIKEKQQGLKKGICPRCGGRLVQRTVNHGPNMGSKFYGCSNYPKCRFTVNNL